MFPDEGLMEIRAKQLPLDKSKDQDSGYSSATSAIGEMDIPASELVLNFWAPFNWTLSFRVIKRMHVVADTDELADRFSCRKAGRVQTPSLTYDRNNNNELLYCYYITSNRYDDKLLSMLLSLHGRAAMHEIRRLLYETSWLPITVQVTH